MHDMFLLDGYLIGYCIQFNQVILAVNLPSVLFLINTAISGILHV